MSGLVRPVRLIPTHELNLIARLREWWHRNDPVVPVLVGGAEGRGGHYVWPKARRVLNEVIPAGSRFYCEGDCRTCPKCGRGNSTIATYCASCRTVLPWRERTERAAVAS
jgi:hypothetical protein